MSNGIDYEIEWLAQRRPEGVALEDGATARARAALLEDMGGAPRGPEPRRRRRPLARLAVGGLAAGGIAAAVVLTTGGSPTTHPSSAGIPAAQAAPLVRLSTRLHARAADGTTALPGDATLVVRHTSHPGQAPTDGADLFSDAGTYYYADSVAGLPAAIASVKDDRNPADDWTFIARDVQAAEQAFDGSVDAAKQRMADAELTPGAPQSDSRAAGKKAAAGRPITASEQEENRIWSNAMNALSAGAGKPAVRAGVLHLLATIRSVTTTKATENGKDVLTLSNVFPDGSYTERLTIDAATGMPIRFSGGDANGGTDPSVTITYDVSRVTVADVAARG
jgi:hypothetical protein